MKKILRLLRRWFADIFYKPGTRRLSLARLIFLLIVAVCIYTTVAKGFILGPWVTLLIALIPYMYLDKKLSEAAQDVIPDIADAVGKAIRDKTEDKEPEP